MKIGYMQVAPMLGDRDATLRKIDSLMAVGRQADILVLPELCNSGYNFESREQALALSEPVGDSVFLRHLEKICCRDRMHIVAGMNEQAGGRLYNTSVLVGPNGVIGKYRKIHLFMNEPDYFEPGDAGLSVYDIGACRIGMLVCFDWVFPEVWRILALQGADVICHPSNLVLPGFAQRAVPVQAMMNRVFVVTANRVGTEGELTFTGLSTIADVGGEVLQRGSQTGEEVGIVEIDVSQARDKMMTPRNDVLGDRRPDEYGRLLDS